MQLKPATSRQLLSGLRGIHFKREPHSGNGRTVLHPCKLPLHVWRLTNTRGGYNPVSTCNWRQEQMWERQHSWTCDVSVSLDLCAHSGRNIFTIQFHNEGFKINMNKQSARCSFRLPLCLHKSEGAAASSRIPLFIKTACSHAAAVHHYRNTCTRQSHAARSCLRKESLFIKKQNKNTTVLPDTYWKKQIFRSKAGMNVTL